MTDFVETTLPVLIGAPAATVPGDVPALGRLVVDNDQAVDQAWVTYGIETDRHYTFTDSSGSGALFYQAESRTLMGGSTVVTGPTGASGGGSNNAVRNQSPPGPFQAILSTQATGGGAHLTHKGIFRVYARVQVAANGTVTLALGWAYGDFTNPTVNPGVNVTQNQFTDARWQLVDLGLVAIPAAATQWEGRVLAKHDMSPNNSVWIDYLMLVPADVASGIVRTQPILQQTNAYAARDGFETTSGALTGRTLPVGGTWAAAGAAGDFTVNTVTHTADRATVSDASRRLALAGTATYSNVYAQVSHSFTGNPPLWGLFARYVDTNNYLRFELGTGSPQLITLEKVVGGTGVLLERFQSLGQDAGDRRTVRLHVDDQGRVLVWYDGRLIVAASHADLATGGALATGRIGFYDYQPSGTASTRSFSDFTAAVPTKDAAIFASQSLEIRHDGARRENSAGTFWNAITVEGDYLRVPPSGAEGRHVRFIVKACRNDPSIMADPGIDDISAQLKVTSRFL